MKRIYKTLSCPECGAEGLDLKVESKILETSKTEEDNKIICEYKKVYYCHCKKCNHDYEVDYGKGILSKYIKPEYETCAYDVVEFVEYESEFERSYKIIDDNGVQMIFFNDDYPRIINNELKDELINDHEKTKQLVYSTWMSRYR